MARIETPLKDWEFEPALHAASEKAGNFNPDCRILASRGTKSDPHVSANIEETGGVI
jgi:hypothetical protein